ncbi:septum site-determining protein MinC [Orrella sp. JC864]|uniref:septum site-determining protein MinC n=1 Tax=Orrella sp. JC864 TaxID=3120298 RepID=UPI003008F74E
MADTAPSPAAPKLALDFKSANLYALRVVLQNADTGALLAALDQRMQDAGSFFQNEPVVIDASRIEQPLDWPALLQALRRHALPPIGVVAEGANLHAAQAAGLVPVELAAASRPQAPAPDTAAPAAALDVEAAKVATAPPPAEAAESGESAAPGDTGAPAGTAAVPEQAHAAAPPAAMVVSRPLRSGQRIYARGTDLIVVGMVSQGAEVIADGNIHVYGPLRGKAMAGARGDGTARIFTTQLDPELLAIAGVYKVVEARLPAALHNRPGVVSLDGDTLHIAPLAG